MDRVVFLFVATIYPTNCKQKNHSFCLCCRSTFYSIELVIITFNVNHVDNLVGGNKATNDHNRYGTKDSR